MYQKSLQEEIFTIFTEVLGLELKALLSWHWLCIDSGDVCQYLVCMQDCCTATASKPVMSVGLDDCFLTCLLGRECDYSIFFKPCFCGNCFYVSVTSSHYSVMPVRSVAPGHNGALRRHLKHNNEGFLHWQQVDQRLSVVPRCCDWPTDTSRTPSLKCAHSYNLQ